MKYSIGKGVAKKLTHTTHGHEQGAGEGNGLREWGLLGGGEQREKSGQL